jgi:hypothetical protein
LGPDDARGGRTGGWTRVPVAHAAIATVSGSGLRATATRQQNRQRDDGASKIRRHGPSISTVPMVSEPVHPTSATNNDMVDGCAILDVCGVERFVEADHLRKRTLPTPLAAMAAACPKSGHIMEGAAPFFERGTGRAIGLATGTPMTAGTSVSATDHASIRAALSTSPAGRRSGAMRARRRRNRHRRTSTVAKEITMCAECARNSALGWCFGEDWTNESTSGNRA